MIYIFQIKTSVKNIHRRENYKFYSSGNIHFD